MLMKIQIQEDIWLIGCVCCQQNYSSFEEAEEFYQDFVELAPRDNDKYILQYEMQKAKKAPIGKLIEILEKYIQEDMEEKWVMN